MQFEIEDGVLKKYTAEPGVTEAVIPNRVQVIGAGAFMNCTGLKRVVLPDGLRSIGEAAFQRCSGLAEIRIPGSVTEIGRRAFYGCSALKQITLPEKLTDICPSVFCGCEGLTALRLPESVRRISGDAFAHCSGLTALTIPRNVRSIGDNAFFKCSRLTELVIPENVIYIGDRAFGYCENLTAILVSPDNPRYRSIDGAVYSRDGAELEFYPCGKKVFTLPDSLRKIQNFVFTGCRGPEVIRLHPDDPELRRPYREISTLSATLLTGMEMIRTQNYTVPINTTIKYVMIMLQYLRTHDAELAAYIKKHFAKIMQESIPAGDICFIGDLVRSEEYFTKRNIDRCIALAQEHRQAEILMLLLNYKNAHFGFDESRRLKL